MPSGTAMTKPAILARFVDEIPHDRTHMFCYFAGRAAMGDVRPFVASLVTALHQIEVVAPGYAAQAIERIASIRGIGEEPYEAIIQVLSEVYVACGAVHAADTEARAGLFASEPGAAGTKNPEFEVSISGHWLAVEVKSPRLIDYSRRRAATEMQLTARLPNPIQPGEPLLPRDNPVKDFLASAQSKFAAYRDYRPGAFHLLVVVWDDFVQEPIAALLNPNSGLFTEMSFCRTTGGQPERFDLVDGVVLIRHQHQLIRATREEPLLDGQAPFTFHGPSFPPKALVPNPHGRPLPDAARTALGLELQDTLLVAEYRPPDLIFWL